MWLLVLMLSIKLQMPTWYWIIFTIITIFRPVDWVVKYNFADGYMKAKIKIINKLITFYNYITRAKSTSSYFYALDKALKGLFLFG